MNHQHFESPSGFAQRMISDLRSGRIDQAAFLERLEDFAGQVRGWRARFEELAGRVPDQTTREVVSDAQESMNALEEALELLRDYAVTRSDQSADEALELMGEATDFLAQLQGVSQRTLEELDG